MRASIFTSALPFVHASLSSITALHVLEEKMPGSLSLDLKRGGSASVSVDYVEHRGRWQTNFTIGGQELTLDVDTGSADL